MAEDKLAVDGRDGGGAPADANYSHPSSLVPPPKRVSRGLGANHEEYR